MLDGEIARADRHAARRPAGDACAPAWRRRAAPCRSTRSGSRSGCSPEAKGDFRLGADALRPEAVVRAVLAAVAPGDPRARGERARGHARARCTTSRATVLKGKRGSAADAREAQRRATAARHQGRAGTGVRGASAARRGARRRARLAGRCHAFRAREEHRDACRTSRSRSS